MKLFPIALVVIVLAFICLYKITHQETILLAPQFYERGYADEQINIDSVIDYYTVSNTDNWIRSVYNI